MNQLDIDVLISQLQNSDIGDSIAEGEWNWINENQKKAYVESLYQKRWTQLRNFLESPLSAQVSYGLMTPIKVSGQDDFISSLSLYKIMFGDGSLTELEHLKLLRHPWSSQTEKFMTYPDSPRHAHFAHKIIETVAKEKIGVEIGGGYGGMVYFLKKFGFKGKLINFDLLESLLIAYIFLTFNNIKVELCFSHEHLFELIADDTDTRVILAIPSLFAVLRESDNIGFVFNSRSLSEMSELHSTQYLKKMNNDFKPEFIFSENAEELLFPESTRHIEGTQSDFALKLTGYKLLSSEKSFFIGGDGRYTTCVYSRLSE